MATERSRAFAFDELLPSNANARERVRWKEFIDSNPPFTRGAAFHGFWGPARIFLLEKVGPAILRAHNEEYELEYHFHADRFTMTLTNKRSEPTPFRFILNKGVTHAAPAGSGENQIGREFAAEAVVLQADGATLLIKGVNRCAKDDALGLSFVEASLAAGETRTVTLVPHGVAE